MDYSSLTREQLLERIEELEVLNRQLLSEREEETKLEYAWSGNLGHWYWNIKTNTVTFNSLKVTTLGYDMSELPEYINYQFFTEKLHSEDYSKTMQAMLDHLHGKANVYEAEYRIRAKDGKYKWYYDRGKITQCDDNGKPLFLAGIVFDVTQKKEMQLELEQKNKVLVELSAVDGLTKISNHRTLTEFLKTGIADASRSGKPLSIAILDIDDFKKVNDSRGHVYGDQVLVDVAVIISNSIRESDIAGRYGGEEFMVIFPGADRDSAVMISERIRQAVEGHTFVSDLKITLSVGVKQYYGEELTELIHSADINLYKAKRNGKNQVAF